MASEPIIYDVSRMSDSEDGEDHDWVGSLIEGYPEDTTPLSLKAAILLAGFAIIIGCMLAIVSFAPVFN